MTTLVYAALNHVRIFHPQVTHVFYNSRADWYYCDDNFNGPVLDDRVDVGLLEDAADSVAGFPAAFAI